VSLTQSSAALHEIIQKKNQPRLDVLTDFQTALWRLNMFEFYEHNAYLPQQVPYTLLAEFDVDSLTNYVRGLECR
jgi:hypothetical protein